MEFVVSAAINAGSELFRTLFYLGALFVIVNMLVYGVCQVIEKIYARVS